MPATVGETALSVTLMRTLPPQSHDASCACATPATTGTVTDSGAVRLGGLPTWPMLKSFVGVVVGRPVLGSISQSSLIAVPGIVDGVIV